MAADQRLLLDTHVFLWWKLDDPRLNEPARHAIANAEVVFVSAVSAWEVAIKQGLGKIRLPEGLSAGVRASGFERLLISFEHAEAVKDLPPHHRDPFDRMLVAQAQTERLVLVTHDRQLEPYTVDLIWT